MNASIAPAYTGMTVVLAASAAVALIQWVFSPQLTQALDWQQTAFVLYLAGIGIVGCLLVLPGLIVSAQHGRSAATDVIAECSAEPQ
jgi:uncharacterized membrane protein